MRKFLNKYPDAIQGIMLIATFAMLGYLIVNSIIQITK